MKRSKLFLAATTCILGIAAFAAKTHRHTSTTGFYSKGSGCNASSAISGYTINSKVSQAVTLQTSNSFGTFTVYSVSRTGACTGNRLYVTGLAL